MSLTCDVSVGCVTPSPSRVGPFCAVLIGIVVEPFTHWFSGLLTQTPFLTPIHEHHFHWALMGLSSAIALGGIGLAWWIYVLQPGLAGRLAATLPGLYQLSLNKFY